MNRNGNAAFITGREIGKTTISFTLFSNKYVFFIQSCLFRLFEDSPLTVPTYLTFIFRGQLCDNNPHNPSMYLGRYILAHISSSFQIPFQEVSWNTVCYSVAMSSVLIEFRFTLKNA